MKEIKLEVGKTYRNRKGKEVKIVGKCNGVSSPYKGNNNHWYTESGRWRDFGEEVPDDLIEEVPETSHTFALVPEALIATRYTFDIPEGVKRVTASQEGNRIVVEMVPEKDPKPGGVMVNKQGSVYIFKGVMGSDNHEHYAWLGKNGRLSIGWWCQPGRPATPEEAQSLWDALRKAGKRWNAETMRVEKVPEIKEPKPGDVMVNTNGSVYIFKEVLDYNTHRDFVWLGEDGRLAIGGTCYSGRHATSEEAQPLFDALKKAGKKWNPETMKVEDVPEIDRIREWVEEHLNDGHYNQQWIAGVIGRYLKHKEGEQ